MKKILIFMLILVFGISCSNTNKTGSDYSGNSNTDQGGSGTDQGGSTATDFNKLWKEKTANQKISKMSYYFDSNGNIIRNSDSTTIYTFYKSLGNDTAIYYYEGDPTDLYGIGDPDSPSNINVKVYCLVKIPEDGNNIYFLDGKQPQNCTQQYAQKITSFVAENNDEPNWTNFPYMTENDIDNTIDIKDNRWSDWGYFGSNIVG
ncbi:hypothetical protein BFL38_04515 [Brachyspira hampsonii]|uniref:Uncharacterized protein n=1 Tax=Brachyspira hampsonii TaxID=1287055 RepID=A0A1E5NCX9_9SPIR|nr:hypothetical protein [Brachyspira hampsonii]OEJ14005.1 hypothetical protein BFL38_04515 [Brachyspira hampsonii]